MTVNMNVPFVASACTSEPDVDVALRDNAIERRDDCLIVLLLVEDPELRFLRCDVGLRDGKARSSAFRFCRSMEPC